MHAEASTEDAMDGIRYESDVKFEKAISWVTDICPYLPNLVRLTAGESISFSAWVSIFLTPGRLTKAEIFHLPVMKSVAIPVFAEDPVKEFVADRPEGRFIKPDGVVSEENEAVFHMHSPCPKRALKSPTMTFPVL